MKQIIIPGTGLNEKIITSMMVMKMLDYNGERADPVSGVFHLGMGYRQYHPLLMRFQSPDSLSPFGRGGINTYAFCTGDPINHADPSGHLSWLSYTGIVAGVLGLAFSVFTAGMSIAAAGGAIAALGAMSEMALIGQGVAVIADVTAIAGGALEYHNPQASSALSWISLAAGTVGIISGLISVGRKVVGAKPFWAGYSQLRNIPLNLHPENASPLRNYKAISISLKGQRLGYMSDVGGSGEPGLIVHGTTEGGYLMYYEGWHGFGATRRIFNNIPEFLEHLKNRFSIEFSMNTSIPLHLIACYSGGVGRKAQQFARYLNRPVIGYGEKEAIYTYGIQTLGDPLRLPQNSNEVFLSGVIYYPDGKTVDNIVTLYDFFYRWWKK